ncbi:MAG: AsnC family transcriptional regulator [Promethearchaeota archaeon]
MDEKDRKILHVLQKNGRVTLSELGKQLGITHVAARKRLRKLLDSESPIMRLTADLSIEKIGIHFAVVLAELDNVADMTKIYERFKDCPRMIFFAPVVGSHNLFAMFIGEDFGSLQAISGFCSFRTMKEVRKSEVFVGTKPVFPQFINIPIQANHTSEKAACGISCKECPEYRKNCVGCPGTSDYIGKL